MKEGERKGGGREIKILLNLSSEMLFPFVILLSPDLFKLYYMSNDGDSLLFALDWTVVISFLYLSFFFLSFFLI